MMMQGRYSSRRTPARVKLLAVAAVLLMIFSAFSFFNFSDAARDDIVKRDTSSIVYDENQSCLEVDVVYHPFYGSAPTITDDTNKTVYGVKYILDGEGKATVLYIPQGVSLNVGDTVDGHTVAAINTDVKKTYWGTKFIETDKANHYATVIYNPTNLNTSTNNTINHENYVYTVTAVNTTILESSASGMYRNVTDLSKSITYYGTVVSTEYNPQAWEFEYERWYSVNTYTTDTDEIPGTTKVFMGWKFATAGTVTDGVFSATAVTGSAYDPGDIIKYKSADSHWYANGTQVDQTVGTKVQIHAYADWGDLKHVKENPGSNLTWNDGSKFQNIVLLSGSSVTFPNIKDRIGGGTGYTVRASNIDDVYPARLSGDECKLTSEVIIDNITMVYSSGKAGNTVNINANSNVFIIGDGIYAIKQTGTRNGDGAMYGQFATLFGGDGDTKMIVHSGFYSDIMGGGGKDHDSITIMNGGVVLDTIAGGRPSGGNKSGETGDLYLYLTGLKMYSNRYTDYLLNDEWSHVTESGNLEVAESSMVIGGNANSKAKSTHVCLTGTSDVWTVQAAGRDAKSSSITQNAELEISGKAVVRNVACGAVTDANNETGGKNTVGGDIIINVRDSPMVANLVGGGYDTYFASNGPTYVDGNIFINLNGGTFGNVYGGGLRGAIGTVTQPVDIHITINSGVTVVKDVYGGGSGTLVKIKHSNTAGNAITQGNAAYKDSTGIASVYGDIDITMNGGTINGSLYGGGKSVPTIKTYGGKTIFDAPRGSVAAVYGDTTVNINGGTVLKDVYGAGRGIDTSLLADNQNAVDNEYSSIFVIMNKAENGQITDKLEFGSIPWAYQDLLSSTKIKVTFHTTSMSMYEEYASVSGDTHVNVSGGTIGGGVYGGSALGKVYGHTHVHITGGTIEGTVYGGGLGVEGRISVTGNRYVTVGGRAYIKGSVYGGSALGTDGLVLVFSPTSTTVEAGDVLTAGSKEYVVSAVNTDVKADEKNGPKFVVLNGNAYVVDLNGSAKKIGDTVKSGSTYTIKGIYSTILTAGTGEKFTDDSDSIIYLKAGTVEGSVFGGGFKGLTYGDTQIFVGKDSLPLADNDVLPDTNSETAISIGGSIYLGGDVGVIESSADAYTKNMVMGGGELYMAKDSESENLTFTGSIMGSGNSCLTRGETTIYLKDLISFSAISAESIHRATYVTVDGCVLELNGRATVENTLANVNNTQYSLYRIEHLNLKGGTILVFNAAVNYIYELNSLNANGDPTTATSPSNKIVIGGGNLFILKEIDWGVVPHKGHTFNVDATTYTVDSVNTDILTVPSGDYAGAKYIVTSGTNVTVVDKNGTTIDKNKTFIVGGTTYKVTSVNTDIREIPSGDYAGMKYIVTTGTKATIIDYVVYTEAYGMANGYTILAERSDEQSYGVLALGDPDSLGGFVLLRSGTFVKADYSDLSEDCRCWYLAGTINNEVTVTAGYDSSKEVSVSMPSLQSGSKYRYTGGTFVPDSPGVDDYISTSGDHPQEGKFQVRFGIGTALNDNERLVFVDDPLHPEYGALMRNDFGQLDPIMGDLEGLVQVRDPYMVIRVESLVEEFRYLGYVLMYVNEVVEVDLGGGNHSYVVVNTIQTKVHIYVQAAEFSNTSMDISIVNGTGSSIFTIPAGKAGYDLIVDSVTPLEGANGVSAFNLTAVKNADNTPGWTNSLGTFVLRTDGSAPVTNVGTLQGGYPASLKIQVNSFTGTGVEKYVLALRIVYNGATEASFTLTLLVSKTPDVSIIFHVDDSTQLKYTYSYGTVVTLPDCPPTNDNFVGWYTDIAYNNPYTFTLPVTRNLELYARYMYTVTMDYMDGTTSVVYVTMPSGVIGAMSNPVRPGYNSLAAYTETEYEHTWDPATGIVTQDMTLYARWSGWNVKVEFMWGDTPVDLDPSKAEHHTGDLLDCQIMEFGTRFNTSDTFTIPGEGDRVMTLLEWAQYNLENIQAYRDGGYRFIYWTYQVIDASGKVVPVYTDSYLSEVERLKTEGGQYYKDTDNHYVVVLNAKVSHVAVSILMDSSVIEEGQSVDNLALVDPPTSFLIFPTDDEHTPYEMIISLNGATRPGYSLGGWEIADSEDGSFVFVNRPEPPVVYPAGTVITLRVSPNGEEGFPYIGEFLVSGSVAETIKITDDGAARMEGNAPDNLVIKFQSKWTRIPYSVSIANPAHGTIFATYYDVVTHEYVRFTDTTLYYGDSVSVIFTPDAGYAFHHWYSSGEGLFDVIDSISTTFVVQGDTNISAYLIGPQIVKVFVEYEGLYNEVAVNDKVNAEGTEYTVKGINTNTLSTDRHVQFIVTDNENKYVTVVYHPYNVPVSINDTISAGGNDYTVTAINTDVLSDAEQGARFIVTDDVNNYVTVIAFYVDPVLIPNLYWENDDTKVYFTESDYISDLGPNHHTVVMYTGTAVLGTHDLYLEGRSFGAEYKLGMPITSTTLQNNYYIMTPRTLYAMSAVPEGEVLYDTDQHLYFVVTNEYNNEATVTKVGDNATALSVGETVTAGGNDYTVVGIGPDAVEDCTDMQKLSLFGGVIYRYGYISVYTNDVKNHVYDSECDDPAGVGTGISALTEYVLWYYYTDITDPEVNKSTDIFLTLEPGYYYFNNLDGTHIDQSTNVSKNVNVTSYADAKLVIHGTVTRDHYTIHIYYGTDYPAASGTDRTVTDVYYGDNYLEVLSRSPNPTVPDTGYSVYAWYLYGSSFEIIDSSMIVSGILGEEIVVYGRYVESTDTTDIWIRTEDLNGTYTVPDAPQTVTQNGTVYYCVDAKPGFVAKYDVDTGVTQDGLRTKVYASSRSIGGNPIAIPVSEGYVVVITYYRAIVSVTITDAVHSGSTIPYKYGETVELVHSEDDEDTHYSGWLRNGSSLTVPVDGYSISLDDVDDGSITITEDSETRKYNVYLLTSQAEIHQGSTNLGNTVTLSIPYGTSIATDGEDSRVLIIGGVRYSISMDEEAMGKYYKLAECNWFGVPGSVTGDVSITYQWVPKTYTLRIVYDDTVTVSGTKGIDWMLFNNVQYIVKETDPDIYTVSGGDYAGVKYIVHNTKAIVFFVPDGVTVKAGDTVDTYTVANIAAVKETTSGIKFIVTDWVNRYVAVIDKNGQTVNVDDTLVQNGPDHTVTVTPDSLEYGSIIRLTLVFSGYFTIDTAKSTYLNPAGGAYALIPDKQSSLQNYQIQFFVTGDMEITIVSKWVGKHVDFYIQAPGSDHADINTDMTLLIGQGETMYLRISDYEYIESLYEDGYYFDGWYTSTNFKSQPTVTLSEGFYCFKLSSNNDDISLYARYVKLPTGDYDMTYDGTAQHVSVKPEIEVPLNMSAVTYSYDAVSIGDISITNVNDSINHKTISYTFTPSKIYTTKVDGVERYVMIENEGRHAYGTIEHPLQFTLNMSKRAAIVVADSACKVYDGTALSCDGYSVYGLVPGDSIGTVNVTGSQTAAGYSANTAAIDPLDLNPNYTVTYYKGTLLVIGTSQASVSLTTSADEVVLSGSDPISVVYSEGSVTVTQGTFVKTISGNRVELSIYCDMEITASGAPALSIGPGCIVTLAVHGDCTFIGGAGYDGIAVAASASLTVTGTGSLTVKGNGGAEATGAGSGIGLVSGTPGPISITRMKSLSAYGYGELAFGIGGAGSTVTIEESTIALARGGFAGETGVQIGGPAIGGRTVTITDSTVMSALGGAHSAAIGGVCQTAEDASRRNAITIVGSTITATGGINGAAIGYGGASVYTGQGLCVIEITELSHITVTGGKYAAGIGTGYRHANLTGFIDGTVSVTATSRDSSQTQDGIANHTVAQDLGYGIIDTTAEGAGLTTVYFYRVFIPTPVPVPPTP